MNDVTRPDLPGEIIPGLMRTRNGYEFAVSIDIRDDDGHVYLRCLDCNEDIIDAAIPPNAAAILNLYYFHLPTCSKDVIV